MNQGGQSARPEASTLSKSMSNDQHRHARMDLINGLSSKVDILFPLMDEVLKYAQLKQGFYVMVMLYACLQAMTVSLWVQFNRGIRDETTIQGKICTWLIRICLISPYTGQMSDEVTSLVILSIPAVLYVLIIIYELIFFKNNRRFIRKTLYIARFCLDFIPYTMMIPCGVFIGIGFLNIMAVPSPFYVSIFVIGIIEYCIFVGGHYVMSLIISATSYLPNSPNVCWNGKFNFILLFGFSFFTLVAWFITYFVNWMIFVFLGVKICFSIFCFYKCVFLPFLIVDTNSTVCGLLLSIIGLDIIEIIKQSGIDIDYYVHLSAIVILFVSGKLIMMYIFKKVINHVTKKLSYDTLEDVIVTEEANIYAKASPDQYMYLSDASKRQLFINDNLHKSKLKALLYLRVGIANACPLFIDWSLCKFLSEFHRNTSMYASILQRLSFFPCESRLLNYYFYLLTTQIHLSIDERFGLFQVHRVKGFRQSSVSSEITEKILELRQYSGREIKFAQRFWENIPRDSSLLYEFATKTAKTTHLFEESIGKWPNNAQMCRDFSQFLIECSTNFTDGLKMKWRAELIDQGVNFAVDHAFKHLVQTYPLYLTKGILDVKGNFISQTKATKGSASSSSNSSYRSAINSNMELDHEVEDTLAKASFTYPRMRLAFQKAIENRKSWNNKELKVASIISLLVAYGIIIFLFIRYDSIFSVRHDNLVQQKYNNDVRYGYDAALIVLLIYWANTNGVIPDELFGNSTFGLAKISPISNDHNLQLSDVTHPFPPEYIGQISSKQFSLNDEMTRWEIFSRKNLIDFQEQIQILANKGDDVSKNYALFIDKSVNFEFCDRNSSINATVGIGDKVGVTLRQAVINTLLSIGTITQLRYKDGHEWMDVNGICECIINTDTMIQVFDGLANSMSYVQINEENYVEKQNLILLVTFVVGYFIIFLPALFIKMAEAFKELNHIVKMMSDIDKTHRDEASKSLKTTESQEETEILNEKRSTHSISACLLYSIIALYIVVAISIFAMIILIASNKNSEFLYINQWQYYGISRPNYMLEIFLYTLLSIIISKKPSDVKMISMDTTMNLARSSIQTLLNENNNLLRGTNINGKVVKPCVGVNDRFDQLNFADDCSGEENEGDFHDTYRCASIDRGITLFTVLIREILDGIDNVKVEYDKPIYHAFHLMNDHLIDPSFEASNILTQLALISENSFRDTLKAICFGSMGILIVFFAILYALLNRVDVAFSGAFQLLRRLPPLCVIANQELLNYLLNKKHMKTHEVMFTSKAVVMNTKEAVFCLNRSQTIEVVNKAVTGLFGYTPEQLLGQPITTIISEEDCPKLYEQFEYMLLGDAPLLFETTTIGLTDDDQKLQISVTAIGISDSKAAESFVVIARDVSVLAKQQEEAQEAKKKSEDLLYQILPRGIVNRLNQGEKDISFVVQSSTVIFIDIVKFSDYASSLTPAQIMENLSMVFAGIDAACAKYDLITKIKLIGDVYMAAANLFTEDEPPSSHATQVVQFGLDVLQALEDVNSLLDSSLQVRIGVNTDGPLIAGVLGTDKPVFDIIGDPINVAARLQSNGIPGTVQISEMTYEAIADSGFNIEKRGEIMLKGKGKKMAYIVRQRESSAFYT